MLPKSLLLVVTVVGAVLVAPLNGFIISSPLRVKNGIGWTTTTTTNNNHFKLIDFKKSYPFQSFQLNYIPEPASPQLVDVPFGFFTAYFFGLGLMYSISRAINRRRMEENAWEQRLQEARERRLQEDPSLTIYDLLRQEAEMEWSAYGPKNNNNNQQDSKKEEQNQQQPQREPKRRRSRVITMEDESQPDISSSSSSSSYKSNNRMTEEEIQDFEKDYGVDYDPYYDDPYTEDELPDDIPYKVDKGYGDRIYKNGEIFYKDAKTGLFYRQGAKPRDIEFWS